jgi:hypothetical protein
MYEAKGMADMVECAKEVILQKQVEQSTKYERDTKMQMAPSCYNFKRLLMLA